MDLHHALTPLVAEDQHEAAVGIAERGRLNLSRPVRLTAAMEYLRAPPCERRGA